MASPARRAASSVTVTPRITPGLLAKESLRNARNAQIQAESLVIGIRGLHRAAFHANVVRNTRPKLLSIRAGSAATVRGRLAPTIVVSVLSYGLYETDPVAITRRIDYTYNAQDGTLLNETAVIADEATARQFGLPVLQRGRKVK